MISVDEDGILPVSASLLGTIRGGVISLTSDEVEQIRQHDTVYWKISPIQDTGVKGEWLRAFRFHINE